LQAPLSIQLTVCKSTLGEWTCQVNETGIEDSHSIFNIQNIDRAVMPGLRYFEY
jgi:hypothetical protein